MDRRTFLVSAGASAGVLALVTHRGEHVAALPVTRNAALALDPLMVPKYADELPRPGVMPKKQVLTDGIEYYEIAVRQTTQTLLPAVMKLKTTVWGYGNASNTASNRMISDTIVATSGVPTRIKWINGLVDSKGRYLPHLLPVDPTLHWANPGGPVDSAPVFANTPGPYTGPVPLVTHVHGAHVGPESDGYAESWYLPNAKNIPAGYATKGSKFDQYDRSNTTPGSAVFHYPNSQRASFLWYHDHALGLTRLNVYAGPAGAYLVTGGSDDMPAGSLPSGLFDIPLVIQDRTFNSDGSLFYPDTRVAFDGYSGPYLPSSPVPPIWQPEYFANVMLVNAKAWPKLTAEPRRYRFRILNGCGSRTVRLKIVATDPTVGGSPDSVQPAEVPFTIVGTDHGFLPAPVQVDHILAAPAERFDVVVDLTAYAGRQLFLINEAPDDPYGGGEPGLDYVIADQNITRHVMRIDIAARATSSDTTPDPTTLSLPTRTPLPAATSTRKVALAEVPYVVSELGWEGPVMTMLGTIDPVGLEAVHQTWAAPVTETPLLGATEEWEICNFTVDAHPIHVHQVSMEVVGRAPMDTVTDPVDASLSHLVCRIPAGGPVYEAPQVWETGLKDTIVCLPQQITKVRAKFDLVGNYVWHCHIIEHEDNEMMRPMQVVANSNVSFGRLLESGFIVAGTQAATNNGRSTASSASAASTPPKVTITGTSIGSTMLIGPNVTTTFSGTNSVAAIRSNTGASITRSATTSVRNGVVKESLAAIPAAVAAASASASALAGTAIPAITRSTNLSVVGATVYTVPSIALEGSRSAITITGHGQPSDQVVVNVAGAMALNQGASIRLVNILPSQVLFNVTGTAGVSANTDGPTTSQVTFRGTLITTGPIKAINAQFIGSVVAGASVTLTNVTQQQV